MLVAVQLGLASGGAAAGRPSQAIQVTGSVPVVPVRHLAAGTFGADGTDGAGMPATVVMARAPMAPSLVRLKVGRPAVGVVAVGGVGSEPKTTSKKNLSKQRKQRGGDATGYRSTNYAPRYPAKPGE